MPTKSSRHERDGGRLKNASLVNIQEAIGGKTSKNHNHNDHDHHHHTHDGAAIGGGEQQIVVSSNWFDFKFELLSVSKKI